MNYDSFATTFSKSRKNHPWPELDSIIEDMRKCDSVSVLDIGCGNGRFLEEIKKLGIQLKDYLGIDNSIGMINEARSFHPDYSFEVGSMESMSNLESRVSNIDSIVFLASFHHLDSHASRIETLKKAKSLLSPKGRIYMTNWNLRDQERYKSVHRGNGDFDIKIGEFFRYYYGFTLDELASLFTEVGFEIEEHRIFEGGRNFLNILSLPE